MTVNRPQNLYQVELENNNGSIVIICKTLARNQVEAIENAFQQANRPVDKVRYMPCRRTGTARKAIKFDEGFMFAHQIPMERII